jgi:hypothetical protein
MWQALLSEMDLSYLPLRRWVDGHAHGAALAPPPVNGMWVSTEGAHKWSGHDGQPRRREAHQLGAQRCPPHLARLGRELNGSYRSMVRSSEPVMMTLMRDVPLPMVDFGGNNTMLLSWP